MSNLTLSLIQAAVTIKRCFTCSLVESGFARLKAANGLIADMTRLDSVGGFLCHSAISSRAFTAYSSKILTMSIDLSTLAVNRDKSLADCLLAVDPRNIVIAYLAICFVYRMSDSSSRVSSFLHERLLAATRILRSRTANS